MAIAMLALLIIILILPNLKWTKGISPGILGIAFAFIAGFFILVPEKDYAISSASGGGTIIINGIPYSLLFNIIAVSLLMAILRQNGSIELIVKKALRFVGGNRKFIPIFVFFLAAIVSGIGVGTISSGIIMQPLVAEVSRTHKLNYTTCALACNSGSITGGMSPLTPTGMIPISVAAQSGVEIGWNVFLLNVVIGVVNFIIFYFLAGDWKLERIELKDEKTASLNGIQIVSVLVLCVFVIGCLLFKLNAGLVCTTLTCFMLLISKHDFKKLLSMVPWAIIILIAGMSMFVKVMVAAGTNEILTNLFINICTPFTAAAILLFTAGMMSIFSSASGVVIPTLTPMAISIASTLGISPYPLIAAVIYGANRTSCSPFSTGGGTILGMAGDQVDEQKLFNDLFKWTFVLWGVAIALALVGIFNIF